MRIAKATLKWVGKDLGEAPINYIVNNEKAIKELFGDHPAMMEILDAITSASERISLLRTYRCPCCGGWRTREPPVGRTCAGRAESRQSGMLLVLKLAGIIAALYLVVVVLVALIQDWLLFPRWAMSAGAPLPPAAERIVVDIGSGEQLVGVHLPSKAERRVGDSLVLGFGGNAWNANDLAIYLHTVLADRDVVAFHYRGYGPSSGSPSARALLEDALTIHDDIVARLAPERIVVVGLSLGAGPAAHLARSRPIAGLVLVTPFDTLGALAREHYPWLPVGLLLRHRMDVAGDLEAVSVPVAVISAEVDTIVPPRRTEAVRRTARTLVVDRTIAAVGHNDLYDSIEFNNALRSALSLIEAGGETR